MATVTHAYVNPIADDPASALAGETLPSHWNAAHVVTGVRDQLTADRTYYRRSDGSDSNTGLVNSAGGAFLTVQKGVDVISSLDLNNHDCTLQVVGAVTENVVLKTCVGSTATSASGWNQPTGPKILGDRASLIEWRPAGASHTLWADACYSPWLIDGFNFIDGSAFSGAVWHAMVTGSGAPIYIGKVNFGNYAGAAHMVGEIRTTESYTISGGAAMHRYLYIGHSLFDDAANFVGSITATISGSPTFTDAFYVVENACALAAFGVTFSGAVTATKRMRASTNGVINTFGTGETYCPGGIAATTDTGGQIV